MWWTRSGLLRWLTCLRPGICLLAPGRNVPTPGDLRSRRRAMLHGRHPLRERHDLFGRALCCGIRAAECRSPVAPPARRAPQAVSAPSFASASPSRRAPPPALAPLVDPTGNPERASIRKRRDATAHCSEPHSVRAHPKSNVVFGNRGSAPGVTAETCYRSNLSAFRSPKSKRFSRNARCCL